jgi:hypothetical protein
MLGKYRTAFIWSCFAAFILLLLFASRLSPSYSECKPAAAYNKGDYEYSELKQPSLSPQNLVWSFIECEGVFLESNSGTLTAIATIAIAGFTIALWRATTKQGEITTDALNLATQEFVATQRPKLRIRLLKMRKLEIGKPIHIEFVLFNVGSTGAKDIGADITIRVKDVPVWDGKRLTKYDDRASQGLAVIESDLAAGDAIIAWIDGLVFEEEWRLVPKDDWADGRIVVIGRIIYADDNGVKRRTAFYRTCSSDVNRFRIPDFDKTTLGDYEYED